MLCFHWQRGQLADKAVATGPVISSAVWRTHSWSVRRRRARHRAPAQAAPVLAATIVAQPAPAPRVMPRCAPTRASRMRWRGATSATLDIGALGNIGWCSSCGPNVSTHRGGASDEEPACGLPLRRRSAYSWRRPRGYLMVRIPRLSPDVSPAEGARPMSTLTSPPCGPPGVELPRPCDLHPRGPASLHQQPAMQAGGVAAASARRRPGCRSACRASAWCRRSALSRSIGRTRTRSCVGEGAPALPVRARAPAAPSSTESLPSPCILRNGTPMAILEPLWIHRNMALKTTYRAVNPCHSPCRSI